MYSDLKTAHSLSLYEVNAMSKKKEYHPDPKMLNAVIVASQLAKGVYRKSKDEKDKSAEKSEKGTKNESDNR